MGFKKAIYTTLFVFLICANRSYGEGAEEDGTFDIAYESLAVNRREDVREIVTKHSVCRILRDVEFETNESILVFMMEHPFFLSATLRAMKINDYLIKQNKDGMCYFDDRKGLSGEYEVVYSAPGLKYFCGLGRYRGWILKLAGRGVILMEYRNNTENSSGVYINANVYAKIENDFLRVLVKFLKPIVIPLMDKKVYKFIKGAQELATEISMHPEKVYHAVKESGYADVKVLEEFRKLTFRTDG